MLGTVVLVNHRFCEWWKIEDVLDIWNCLRSSLFEVLRRLSKY